MCVCMYQCLAVLCRVYMHLLISFPQTPIIDSGFLPELSQLLILQQYPEIQFHAAGTIRNLATEEFTRVHCIVYTSSEAWGDWTVLTKAYYLSPLQSLVVFRAWQRSSVTTRR